MTKTLNKEIKSMQSVFESIFNKVNKKIEFYMIIGRDDNYIEEKICDWLSSLELSSDNEVSESANAIDGSLLAMLIRQKRSARSYEVDQNVF